MNWDTAANAFYDALEEEFGDGFDIELGNQGQSDEDEFVGFTEDNSGFTPDELKRIEFKGKLFEILHKQDNLVNELENELDELENALDENNNFKEKVASILSTSAAQIGINSSNGALSIRDTILSISNDVFENLLNGYKFKLLADSLGETAAEEQGASNEEWFSSYSPSLSSSSYHSIASSRWSSGSSRSSGS